MYHVFLNEWNGMSEFPTCGKIKSNSKERSVAGRLMEPILCELPGLRDPPRELLSVNAYARRMWRCTFSRPLRKLTFNILHETSPLTKMNELIFR